MSLTKMVTHILQFPPKHHIYIYTNAYQYIFFYFLSTAVICYPETTCSEAVRRSGGSLLCLWQHCALHHWTLWKRTANNVPQDMTFREGGGGLRTPQTNQMQAHKVRFGRGKGASHTCCATNGALSGDCWQRQLCPSGAKLDVTKTQLNLWDIQIVISMFLYLKCFFSNKKALFFNSASHISIY